MMNKKIKILLSLFLAFIGLYAYYLLLFPNDWFLSDQLFRSDPNYQVHKTFFSYEIYYLPKKNQDLENLMTHLDESLKIEKGWFKNNVKRTVSIVEEGSSRFFVKRYNIKNLYDYITKCPFRSSKAYRSFYYAHLLDQEHISTPKTLALIEKRWGPFWTKTYLITEVKEGKTIKELDDLSILSSKMKKQIKEYLDVFKKNKWVNQDFNDSNLLICKEGIYLIDLDEMHRYTFNSKSFRKKFKKKHAYFLKMKLDD